MWSCESAISAIGVVGGGSSGAKRGAEMRRNRRRISGGTWRKQRSVMRRKTGKSRQTALQLTLALMPLSRGGRGGGDGGVFSEDAAVFFTADDAVRGRRRMRRRRTRSRTGVMV